MNINLANYLFPVIEIAKKAGDAILQFYQHPEQITVTMKQDASPVTEADLAAHQIIKTGLQQLTPDIPILSEEEADISFQQRQQWQCFWLIDPLDGTKEFIHRTDDFTVNIALIENHQPVFGIIYAPMQAQTYYAYRGYGAYKQNLHEVPHKIHTRKFAIDHPVIAISRRHGINAIKIFLNKVDNHELITRGSSIKSCLVAEGKVDVYPCLGVTSEWDMAAAQCIVQEAGGNILNLDFEPFLYNKKDSFLNPPLLIVGDTSYDWQKYF
jgi:3'(2'), 5'-bisphosphate nucleotidase